MSIFALKQCNFLHTTESCRESLEEADVTSLRDKISGEWIADLQHTQENEIKTTTDLIGDKVSVNWAHTAYITE